MGFIINPYQVQPSVPAFTGILDTYTGAAVGYSAARRLSSSYTGSLIRVRRSSDNTEQDIGYDSNNVLDESALTSFVGANNGFVVKWYDQSGNSKDATQSTAANQPQIVVSGSINKTNNKPSIKWVDPYFLSLTRISDVQSVFIVNKNETNNNIGYLLGDVDYYDYHTAFNSTGYLDVYASSFVVNGDNYLNNTLTNFSSTGIRTVNQQLVTMIHTSNSARVNQLTKDRPFNNRTWYGTIQEIILYPSSKSSDRTSINSNINTFYSIY